SDPQPAVRQSALIALGRLGFSSSFEPVATALREGVPDVRFQAATSLAEIDPTRAADPLLTALEDSDGEVVGAAALALGALGERRAIAPMVELLGSWSRPTTRFDLAYALADLDDTRAVDTLLEFIDHKDAAWDAIESLEKLGAVAAERMIAPLTALLARRFLTPRIKLRAAATVLAVSAPTDASSESANNDAGVTDSARAAARAARVAGLRARKLEDRGLAVQQLGRVGGEWALAPLAALGDRRAGRPLVEDIAESIERIRARQ
ncbi:MAG: HEAT repeat domain-containing protein, partial [Myxococcota bacterium]